jgi:hypothetical protein
VPSYFGLLDFFFLRALAWAMFDSAKKRKVATPIGLVPSVSNLSAVVATFFAKRRNRLRVFLLKRKGPPIGSMITSSVLVRLLDLSGLDGGVRLLPA